MSEIGKDRAACREQGLETLVSTKFVRKPCKDSWNLCQERLWIVSGVSLSGDSSSESNVDMWGGVPVDQRKVTVSDYYKYST